MIRMILFDFGKTLAVGSGNNAVAEFMGRGELYHEIYPQFQSGQITGQEYLTQMFHNWRGM